MSTKKTRIAIIVMIVLLVGAIGGYIAVDKSKTNEENKVAQENAELNLFNFDSNSISQVEISNAEFQFSLSLGSDGTWSVTDTTYEHEFLVNSYYLNSVCSYMSALTAQKKIDIGENTLASYGLDDPTVLTCSDGNHSYTLYLGDPSATQEYYYVMQDDKVFGIDFNTGEVLAGGIAYLKDPYMIPVSETVVTKTSIEKGGESIFSVEIGEDNLWHMISPLPEANVNSAQVNSFLTSVTRIQVEGYPAYAEEVSLSDYGLDKPEYIFKVATDEKEYVYKFAPFTGEDTSTYFVEENSGQIGTILTNSLGFLKTEPQEILMMNPITMAYEDAKELDVTVDDLHFVMQMNHQEGKYQLDEIAIDELDSNINNLFKNLYLTVKNISYEEMNMEAEIPEDAKPACEFRFTGQDGTETTLSLIQRDDTTYYAMLDGTYTGFTVRRRALSSNTGVLTYFEKITDALTEAGIDYTPSAVIVSEPDEETPDSDTDEEPEEESPDSETEETLTADEAETFE